jgi:hypothetical protein
MLLNRTKARFKFSKFEQKLNRFVVMLFGFNLVVCAMLAAGNVLRDQGFAATLGIEPSDRGVGLVLLAQTACVHSF